MILENTNDLLDQMLSSDAWDYYKNDLMNDLALNDPDRLDRVEEYAKEGGDGSTHGEVIEDWREFAPHWVDDLEPAKEIAEKIISKFLKEDKATSLYVDLNRASEIALRNIPKEVIDDCIKYNDIADWDSLSNEEKSKQLIEYLKTLTVEEYYELYPSEKEQYSDADLEAATEFFREKILEKLHKEIDEVEQYHASAGTLDEVLG